MATLGGNTVITADVVLHDFLRELVRDTEGHRLFEIDNLIKLNKELKAYGYQMAPTHHMFLPCRDTIIEDLPEWIDEMRDPRCKSYCIYTQADYIYMGIMKNICGQTSMSSMEEILESCNRRNGDSLLQRKT